MDISNFTMKAMNIFYYFEIVCAMGMFSSAIQKIVVYRIKDNVQLAYQQLFLEMFICVVSFMYVLRLNDISDLDTLLST